MSFLAQLRQQQNAQPPALQLFYRLTSQPIEANAALVSASLHLQLFVATSPGDIQSKSYQPNPEHLTHAPPFIQASDKPVLSILLKGATSPGWPIVDAAALNDFIALLFATQRVVFLNNAKTTALTYAAPHTLKLMWQTQDNGQQALCINNPLRLALFYIVDPFFVVSCNTALSSCLLASTQGDALNAAELELIKQSLTLNKRLKLQLCPSETAEFLALNRARWQTAHLPLPQIATATPLAANIRGHIHCTSQRVAGKNIDALNLNFIYSAKDYSTYFKAGAYGDFNAGINDLDKEPHYVVLANELYSLARNYSREAEFIKVFNKATQKFNALEFSGDYLTSAVNEVWQAFFIQQKRELEKHGFIFTIDASFKRHYIEADRWLSQLKQKTNGFLQVDLFVGVGQAQINLLSLLEQIHQYNLSLKDSSDSVALTLDDGRILLLAKAQVIKLSEEFGDLLVGGRSSLDFHPNQSSRLNALNSLLPDNTEWQGDTEFLQQSQKLFKEPRVIDQTLCGINAVLRPYQWLGVCWLQHLKDCNSHGLLADDMGLGKTLQTIAHLSLEFLHNPKLKPALIVVPTSLLHNWYNECQKFAPHLNVLIYHGSQRKTKRQHSRYHLLITSYQLVANDADYFETEEFSWAVLDEAQNIKNPRTKTHIAIKKLNADFRLCLSGTPIENNLTELWALFNFLAPNCLGGLRDFKFNFQKPIEQDGNAKKLEHLLARIAPFMLRRTKKSVAKDLPEKTEILQTLDFCEQQRNFYDSIKSNTWQELQQQLLTSEKPAEQQIFVLSALLKLRQACCDPALLGADAPSAKRKYCLDMAQEMASEGRAVLIFSQFTRMLDILARELKDLNIDYGLLTGKTQNRQALVDDFQAGKFPVFLISLKAGGVGLNLTRADTVIHYDPWWNSAAEQQATDRAHRIGQKNNVFVYRLICENTIEEKIAALQARKAELGQYINDQAQHTGAKFSLKLEELLALWQDPPQDNHHV